jgi:hypothetical protein
MQILRSSSTFVRGLLLLTIALAYLIHSITSIELSSLLVVLVVITFFVSWPSMSKFPKVMSTLLVVFGNVIFFYGDGNAQYWEEAILDNVGLVALFISVPLLSYPLRHGGYIQYMDDFAKAYLNRETKMIGFITAVTCVISSFLNLGALRVVYDLFSKRLGSENQVYAKSLIQGFSLAAFWSPYFAGVAIILHLVGVSFISFLVYGLVIVVIGFMTSCFINIREMNKHKKTDSYTFFAAGTDGGEIARKATPLRHRKGIELLIVFIGLFLALFLLEKWLHFQVLILISLVAFIYPFIWSMLIRKIREFVFSMKEYIGEVVPNIHNESIMIISATFFSQMIVLTSFPNLLSEFFLSISNLSIFLTVLIIILTCVATAFFIHQVLPISIFATTLSPEVIGLKPELFALALVVSWGLIPLLSPVSAANLIAGNLFRTKTFEIGLWNLKYIFVIIFLTSFVIYVMNMFTF